LKINSFIVHSFKMDKQYDGTFFYHDSVDTLLKNNKAVMKKHHTEMKRIQESLKSPMEEYVYTYKFGVPKPTEEDLYKLLKKKYEPEEKESNWVQKVVTPPKSNGTRWFLAKLEKRDVYVFVKTVSKDVKEIRNQILKEVELHKYDDFVTKIDDLVVIYNQEYEEFPHWNMKESYVLVNPFGKTD